MSRPWPSFLALLPLFLCLVQQSLACVDVLFVIDNKTLEVSRNRALQVARQLPEDQKIRKWVVLSRNDRYVPRVLRNNAELQSVLSTIHGDYDRFLEIATGEIARRTATFQPFVILLFSETPVNQTMTNMWRSISLAPALHIYRIGSFQRTNRMLSEDQETDFEKLILCGRNKTDLFNLESSKFSGGNEIRRSPTSTPRPWTSTRDSFVRRLTFYDASRTVLEEKRKQQQRQKEISSINTKFTITRTFKKITTKAMSTTRTPSTTPNSRTTRKHFFNNRTPTKYDSKKSTTRRPFILSTKKSFSTTRRVSSQSVRPNTSATRKQYTTMKNTSNRVSFTTATRRPYSAIRKGTFPASRKPFHATTKTFSTISTTPYMTSNNHQYTSTKRLSPSFTTTPRSVIHWESTRLSTTRSPQTTRTTRRPLATIRATTARTVSGYNMFPTTSRPVIPSRYSSSWRAPTTTPKFRWWMTTRKPGAPFWTVWASPIPTTTMRPFTRGYTSRLPFAQTITRRPQTTTKSTPTRKPWWMTESQKTRTTHLFATTPSSAPVSTIDLPPREQEENELMKINGRNFKVRSRSVHFAMTEKPPVTTAMNPMKFFTTSRTPITPAKALIPFSCTADVFFLVDLSQGTGDKSQHYSGPGRTHVRVYLDKHNDKDKLIEEMFLMERHGGTTRTADAIRYATKIFEGMAHPARKNVKKVLVVFTDGYSQDHPRDAARVARAKGLQLIAVAVKDRLAPPDEEQLAEIGGHARNVFISPNGRELREKIIGTQCRL